jgi:Concanavalin A-like lectin/glucanases superfamily
MKRSFRGVVVLFMSCAALLVSLSTGEHPGLTNGAPSPIVHLEASEYEAGSTTWANKGSTGGTLATATGGMAKTATGPHAAVFAGKESTNSDQVAGSIGSTASVTRVSVEMWVRLKDNGSNPHGNGSMLFSWTGSSNYNVYHTQGKLGFNVFKNELYGVNASSLENNWTHIVLVMSNSQTASHQKIYVNGIAQTLSCHFTPLANSACVDGVTGRSFTSSGDFLLMNNGYSANTWNAKADVGMVRIYNSELTQSEVTAAFDATKVNGYVDNTAPSVDSVIAPTSPSTSRNLSYSYTFSESITGLVSNSFEVGGTATGCTVTPASSSGTTIQVAVTCSTDGTVVLQLKQNSIADLARLTGPTSAHVAPSISIAVPVVTTTAAPVVTTTAAPVVTTTAAPIVTTTVAPVVTTTVTPVTTTIATAAPVATPTTGAPVPQPQTAIAAPPVTTRSAPRAAVTTTTVPTVTTSVVPATTTTTSTVPVMSTIDIPKMESTSAVLEVNGESVAVNVARQNNQLQITSKTFSAVMQIVKRDGSVSSLNSSGAMSGEAGDSLNVEFDGLQPGSMLEARLYSDPVVLGRTEVPSNGTISASYVIPEAMKSGGHSLAVLGIDASGDPISFFAPVDVQDGGNGPGLVAFLIAIPVLVAIGAGLFLPPVIRRRRVA